jgi:hypothetical protein
MTTTIGVRTTAKLMFAALAAALLMLGGCAAGPRANIAMPVPASGDVEGQIMSVTGTDFTICGVSGMSEVGQTARYVVTVCGNLDPARLALDAQFPGQCIVVGYQPGDGGGHTPKQLVVQWWINRAAGPGWKVTSTEITDNGLISVGIDGDLTAATAALERDFPGWTRVHSQAGSQNL